MKKTCMIFLLCASAHAFATNWSYSESAKTITDGHWVIAVSSYDSAGTLKLGASIKTAAPDGVLDLRDMRVNGVDVTEVSLPSSMKWKSVAIKKFYVNKVRGDAVPATLKGNTTIEEVEIGSETIEKVATSQSFFTGCTALGRLRLKCPQLVNWELAANPRPFEGTVISNEFREIVNPWVTNVGSEAFCDLNGTGGEIVLTNLVNLDSDAFSSPSDVREWKGITNIDIRTEQAGRFEVFGNFSEVEQVRIEAARIEKLVGLGEMGGGLREFILDCGGLEEIGEGLVRMGDNGVVRILNGVWGEGIMTNLLGRLVANQPSGVVLQVYKNRGWETWGQDFGAGWERDAAPEGCFGVWREGESARGAWMVDLDALIKKYTCIRIR